MVYEQIFEMNNFQHRLFIERTVDHILKNSSLYNQNPLFVGINELVQTISSNLFSIIEFHENLDIYLRKHYFELQPLFHNFELSKSSTKSSSSLYSLKNLVSKLLSDKSEILPKISKLEKDVQKFVKKFQKKPLVAKKFLCFAQDSFRISQNYKKCIENCNYSIIFAPAKSKTLSLAYYFRSRSLSELSYHEKALSDLDEALSEGLLEHCFFLSDEINDFRYDILLRFSSSNNYSLEKNPIQRYEKIVSGACTRENQFKCSKIEFENDPVLGRKVVLNSSVKKGEILFIEKAEVAHLLPQYEYFCCDYCLIPLEKFLSKDEDVLTRIYPCSKCINVVYCSKQCLMHALEQYHNVECSLYAILSMFGIGHLAFRMMLITNNISKINFRERSKQFVSNLQHQDCQDLFQFTGTCLFLENLLKCFPELETFSKNSQDTILELVQNILILISNAQSVESSSMLICDESNQDFFPHQVLIGSALYDILPTLNHSCVPNITVSMENGCWAVVRALNDLPSKTELRNSYGVHAGMMCYEERKQTLLDQYHFSCDCSFCDFGTLFDPITNEVKSLEIIVDKLFIKNILDPCELNVIFNKVDHLHGRFSLWNLNFCIKTLIKLSKKQHKKSHENISSIWMKNFINRIRKTILFYDPLSDHRIDNEYQVYRSLLDKIEEFLVL